LGDFFIVAVEADAALTGSDIVDGDGKTLPHSCPASTPTKTDFIAHMPSKLAAVRLDVLSCSFRLMEMLWQP
jgi:hypothetical protein